MTSEQVNDIETECRECGESLIHCQHGPRMIIPIHRYRLKDHISAFESFDPHPDGEWVRYAATAERIAGLERQLAKTTNGENLVAAYDHTIAKLRAELAAAKREAATAWEIAEAFRRCSPLDIQGKYKNAAIRFDAARAPSAAQGGEKP